MEEGREEGKEGERDGEEVMEGGERRREKGNLHVLLTITCSQR